MIFWIAIGLIATASIGVLALPLRNLKANATAANADTKNETTSAREFYQQQLAELHRDVDENKLGDAEFEAAKLELDKEFLRQNNVVDEQVTAPFRSSLVIGLSAPLILLVAFSSYIFVGNPGMSNAPLVERMQSGEGVDIVDAIAKIEQRLIEVPDDLQGWKVIAPVYMRQQAFEKAATAFQNIVRIEGETADNLTNLAEATVLVQQGDVTGEPMKLLKRALEIDPDHVRSQFYLAGEATRLGEYGDAISRWTNILRDTVGTETWLETARAGLKVAQDGLQSQVGTLNGPTQEEVDAIMQMSEVDRTTMIQNMVTSLEERLFSSGGSPQEWQQLLRARLVQGEHQAAQKALVGARDDLKDDSNLLAEFEKIALEEIAQLDGLEE